MDALEAEFLELYDRFDEMQVHNITRTIENMRYGADALIDETLLGDLDDDNSKSVLLPDVAQFYTDQLATMVKKGYVCGPFDESPIENLRINSLFAVNQSDKYRPILNLSKPEGNSFNEAIVPAKMRKVTMSTPKQVAATIYAVGKDAILSKVDHVSAYKLVPVKPEQYYLQGFRWLGKLFIEVRLIFGSRSSVPNYDDFHETFSLLVKTRTDTDPQFLHRTLDDQVSIMSQDICKAFMERYLSFASEINLPLADMSGSDKAFLYRKSGTILGVQFDTTTMTWKYADNKRLTHMKIIEQAIRAPVVTKEMLQKVSGVINCLVLMCPALKFLRAPIIRQLSDLYAYSPLPLAAETVKMLHTWLHIFHGLSFGFPIPKFIDEPPLYALAFVSDAAGLPDPEHPPEHQVGVGATGFVMPYDIIQYVGQAFWPMEFVTAVDVQNKLFGRKTTLLEAIGLILPLYHNVQFLVGKHVVLYVDNLPTVWAFQKGRSKKDDYTSVIISAIHHVAMSLPCKFYVRHCPRLSTTPAMVADLLTRSDQKGLAVAKKYSGIQYGWPTSLLKWMRNPSRDWSLGHNLLCDFKVNLRIVVFFSPLFG